MCCDDSCNDHCRVVFFYNITSFKNAAKESPACPDNINKFILFWGKYNINKTIIKISYNLVDENMV